MPGREWARFGKHKSSWNLSKINFYSPLLFFQSSPSMVLPSKLQFPFSPISASSPIHMPSLGGGACLKLRMLSHQVSPYTRSSSQSSRDLTLVLPVCLLITYKEVQLLHRLYLYSYKKTNRTWVQ